MPSPRLVHARAFALPAALLLAPIFLLGLVGCGRRITKDDCGKWADLAGKITQATLSKEFKGCGAAQNVGKHGVELKQLQCEHQVGKTVDEKEVQCFLDAKTADDFPACNFKAGGYFALVRDEADGEKKAFADLCSK